MKQWRVLQDFPIRGKAVYMYVRRRRWRDSQDGSVFSYDYDLTKEGSRLTPQFVAFLKGPYWNEWEGLTREHVRINFNEDGSAEVSTTDKFTYYKYDCGICF